MSLNENSSSILVQPTLSKKKKKRRSHRRRVSFNNMAEVCVLETSSTMSESDDEENIDPSDLWWGPRDYRKIKNRCIHTVKRKMQNQEGNHECRGLERLMDNKQHKTLITSAVRAVTREQSRQRLDGDFIDSDLCLAEVYRAYCHSSSIKAELLGRLDELEARAAIETNWTEPLSEQVVVANKPQAESQKSNFVRSNSSSRNPFQSNLKSTLNNMVTRRRRAWI